MIQIELVNKTHLIIMSEDKNEFLDQWARSYANKDGLYNIKLDYMYWNQIRHCKIPLHIEYCDWDNEIDVYNCPLADQGETVIYQKHKIDDCGFGEWVYDNYFSLDAKIQQSLSTSSSAVYQPSVKENSFSSTISFFERDSWGLYTKEKENDLTVDNNNKEKNKMNNGFNFDFGPCTENNVRISIYGIAIKNIAGEWVSYNPDAKEIVNVDIFNFENGGKYLYKIPVAISDIAIGDVVIHNKVPMFVNAINLDGTLSVTDVREGEAKNIILTKNMFGFNFATKVVSLFSAFGQAPTPDQPFGNMLPLMLLNNEGDNEGNIDPLLILAMTQKDNKMFANPMMLYCLMNKSSNNDNLLPLMMLSSENFKF